MSIEAAFDPSQPRDDHGRWEGDGGSNGNSTPMGSAGLREIFERIGGGRAGAAWPNHDDDRDGVRTYAGNVDAMIWNHALRTGTFDGLRDSTKEDINSLTAAIDEAPRLSEDVTAYRFVKNEFADQLKPGVEFEDKGFTSTTLNEEVAQYHAKLIKMPCKTLRIKIPKGIKATAVHGSAEYELILQRGARFKVMNTNHYLDMEALGV